MRREAVEMEDMVDVLEHTGWKRKVFAGRDPGTSFLPSSSLPS